MPFNKHLKRPSLLAAVLALALMAFQPASPAVAGTPADAGGGRDFFEIWAVMGLALLTMRNPSQTPQVVKVPLGDGTRLYVYVNKGRIIGYIRTN